jgi:hypothetical protein
VPRLTEANYLSRRVKLTAQIVTAQSDLSDAGLRRELDEATDEQVSAAREALTALTDRLTGLDAAWDRSQLEAASEASTVRDAEAAASHGLIIKQLDIRRDAGVRMEEAAKELAARYSEYQDAGSKVVGLALKHTDRFTHDRLLNLRDLFKGDFHDVRQALGRTMTRGGLNLTGIKMDGFSSDYPHQRSVTAFTARSNDRAAAHASVLVEAKEA